MFGVAMSRQISERQRETFRKLGRRGAEARWGRDYGESDLEDEDINVLRDVGHRFGRYGGLARSGRTVRRREQSPESPGESEQEEEEEYPRRSRYRTSRRSRREEEEEESPGEEEEEEPRRRRSSGRNIDESTRNRFREAGRRGAASRWGYSRRRYD